MQPILDGPRAGLSEAKVRALLQSHSTIRITYGATALDASFGVVADISNYMSAGSSVTSSTTDSVNRTCSLNIDANVTDTGWSYLSGYIRPHMTITDVETGYAATFHLGVYTLTTPTRMLGSSPATLSFSGYDLNYLLRQPIGDSYEVPAGSDPVTAAIFAINIAVPGVEVFGIPSGSPLPLPMSWPFDASQPATYQDVVNGLLASVGYEGVWVDWDGHFHIEPFTDPQMTPYEWTFDVTHDDNIVVDHRSQDIDTFDVPNWWRFVMDNLDASPVEGESMFTYTDASASNPGSTANRRQTVKYIETVTAATFTDMMDYAQRTIASTLKPSETFTVQTQPFPLAWHRDIINFRDPALVPTLPATLGGERRVVSVTWSLPLDGQTDMEWTWQTVTEQTAALGFAPGM